MKFQENANFSLIFGRNLNFSTKLPEVTVGVRLAWRAKLELQNQRLFQWFPRKPTLLSFVLKSLLVEKCFSMKNVANEQKNTNSTSY